MNGLTVVAAVLILAGVSACACVRPKGVCTDLKRLAPYLYEGRFTSHAGLGTVKPAGERPPACSAVRNGDFYGRNLDFYYNDVAEVVVHLAAAPGRYASVAVCTDLVSTPEDFARGLSADRLAEIPCRAYDGINEKGVCCNVNVVPAADVPPLTGTNPGKPRLDSTEVVRMVLDRAGSAKEALELLKEYDISGGLGVYSFHYMINDPQETYIVEFIGNEIRTTRQNIMVNFYHTLPAMTPFGSGRERYAILKDHYAEGTSRDGMAELMRRVRYTQAYSRATDPFWYTEFVMCKGADGRKLTTASSPEEFKPAVDDLIAKNAVRNRATGKADGIWHTVHTSIYDIPKRTLRLFVQEDYSRPFDFTLGTP